MLYDDLGLSGRKNDVGGLDKTDDASVSNDLKSEEIV